MCAFGGSRGGGKGTGLLPRGTMHAGSFVLKVFLSLLQLGTLGEFSGEDLNKIFICFPGVSFQGHGSMIGQHQGRGSLVTTVGPGFAQMV